MTFFRTPEEIQKARFAGYCTEENCKNPVTENQKQYSLKKYKKILCWDHQGVYKLSEKQNPYEEPTYQDIT